MTVDRRTALTLMLAGATSPAFGQAISGQAMRGQAMSSITAFAFSFPVPHGEPIRLADHTGKPMLIVNTASLCGLTPQFKGLQELWTTYRDRGLLIVGVPSNDFNQEPGDATAIAETAHHHGVTFPIAAKAELRGPNAHPFYKWAATERPKELPRWNFHKYLVGRNGHIADVFPERVEPTDTRVVTAIARQLDPTPRAVN